MESERISALVLAGGQGSRMGGADKGLLLFQGKPLFLHVVEKIAPFCDEIMLSANRNLDHYRQFGFPVYPDSGESLGPLSGVKTGLEKMRNRLLFVAPCDTPFLPADLLPRLSEALAENDADVAVAASGGRIHHALMLCRKSVLPSLVAYLSSGKRSIWEWQETLKKVVVEFSDPRAFENLNTPEALEKITSPSGEKP